MKDQITDYIERLQVALKNLPPQKQKQILSEIESHFADGLQDEQLGTSIEERKAILVRELGNPGRLAYELQQVNRRQRWIEFLLAVIPALFLTEIIKVIVMRTNYPSVAPLFNEIALATLPLCIAMLFISRWRGSDLLLIFWLLVTLDKILAPLQWSILGDPQIHFALLWIVVGLTSFSWLILTLWRLRHVPLLVGFGVLPLLMHILESIPVLESVTTFLSFTTNSLASQDIAILSRLQPAAIVLELILTLIALGFFFISFHRLFRWLALGLLMLTPSLANAIFFGLNGDGSYIIIVLPVTLLVLLLGIIVEQHQRKRLLLHS